MRGSSLITEGAWPGRGELHRPRESVRTRSQLVRSWRSRGSKTRTGACALGLRRCCGLLPRPLSLSPPLRLALSGRGGSAAKIRPIRVTRVGAGVHRPRPSRRCSPTLPAPPHLAPTANSGAAERGPRRGADRAGREPGDERGATREGRAHHILGAHRPRLRRGARTLGE